MRSQLDRRSPDQRIAALARAQEGVASVAQLRAAGFGKSALGRRVRSGRWRRLHRGVYALGLARLGRHGQWWAAVLACGDGAVLSHLSAAALWGIHRFESARTHVTVATRAGRAPDRGIILHRVATLDLRDATIRQRIPVTSPASTLFDLATVLGRRELERAFDEADRLRLLKLDRVRALVAAQPGRRGNRNLTWVLNQHRVGSTRTRNWLEETFLAACDRQGLPRPAVNARLEDGDEVDFLWPEARLVVETDGGESHRTRYAFEEDRARDVRQALADLQVLRFTHDQIEDDPDAAARATDLVYRRRSGRELPTSRARSNSGSG